MIEMILQITLPLLALYLGSIEYRMRNLNQRLCEAASRREIHDLIDLKLEALHIMDNELKSDIRALLRAQEKLSDKIDKLIQELMKR